MIQAWSQRRAQWIRSLCWQPDRRVLDNILIAATGSRMTSLAKELAAKTDQDGAWYLPDKWSEDMKDETGQPMSKRQGMQ